MNDIFIRSKLNPILKPNPNHDWENLKVYNPGVFYENHKFHMFYRAVGKGKDWHSVIGYAVSEDGENFQRFDKPILGPEIKQNLHRYADPTGFEDPRIVKIVDQYYLTYTVYDGIKPQIYLAISSDLKNWQKTGPLFPDFPFFKLEGFRVRWEDRKPVKYFSPIGKYDRTKSAGIFPDKISGKYWMIFNEYLMWIASSEDGLNWQYKPKPFLTPRTGNFFDNVFVEMGPPPIKTSHGWLVLYHGVNRDYIYSLGFLLLDIDNPEKIIYRSPKPIFWPEVDYEQSGLVDKLSDRPNHAYLSKNDIDKYKFNQIKDEIMPQVVFCCGAVVRNDRLHIYYGAGDTFVCKAVAQLKDLIK